MIGDIFPIDEYGLLTKNNERARLANVSDQLAKIPGSVAVVILRVPKQPSRITFEARRRTVTDLFQTLRVKTSDFVIVNGGIRDLETVIYIVPREDVPIYAKP